MTKRIARKILARAADNFVGLRWPKETYNPPERLIRRAIRTMPRDDLAGAFALGYPS